MSRGFLEGYEPVEERLARFWAEHPKGRVVTEIVQVAQEKQQRWIVKALVYREGEPEPAATGYAFEVDGSGNVNNTSALENCETSAVGRALAQMGYAPKGKRPSREEMSKLSGASPPNPRDVPSTAPDNGKAFTDAKDSEGGGTRGSVPSPSEQSHDDYWDSYAKETGFPKGRLLKQLRTYDPTVKSLKEANPTSPAAQQLFEWVTKTQHEAGV